VMARETGGWKWPMFALSYMLALAWGGAFVTYRISSYLI
jgi:Fe2+ transport system protein B